MFANIPMIDYARPLAERVKARKSSGPYTWTPAAPNTGRGFYQASKGFAMDPRGSTLDLRIELANDHLERTRLAQTNGYYCDQFQDQTLVPIVARLPRSRGFLAGWTMGRGMCASLEPDIHETAREAALAAHEQAERDAERERDYQAKESAAMRVDDIAEELASIRTGVLALCREAKAVCGALSDAPAIKGAIRAKIERAMAQRETLRTERAKITRGDLSDFYA